MKGDKADLKPGAFPADLKWTGTEVAASLEGLHDFVNQECDRAIKWYLSKKRNKRISGVTFRVIAIFAAAVSGVIPVLAEIYKNDSGRTISPAWATIALAVAAVCITLDRFGGYTSGWVRYVRTSQALSQLQSDFWIEWEKRRLILQGGYTNPEMVQQAIQLCQDFLEQVHAMVRAETNQWAQEFQKMLVALDEKVKKKE